MKTHLHVGGGVDAPPPPSRAPLPHSVDVLIVGLGPVGALIANLLARYGVHVLAVDKAHDIFTAPRAIALDNEALRILQMAGIAEADFETIAIRHVRLRSPQLGEFARANTLGSLDGHPKLVTFHQPSLERLLRSRLDDYSCAQVALGVTLKNVRAEHQGVWAELDLEQGRMHTVRADYLVGADGAGSLVRKLIGQGFRGKTFAEDWLVIDARHAPKPIDDVEFYCCSHRPIPRMVAPGGRQRWEFMLRPEETSQEMESDERVRELLAPWGNIEEMSIERKAVYRFHARVVDSFRQGRVFLAGDAAHITPPFVGQGLVAGLRDAANLSWKLAWVIQGRAMPHILDSYDQERRPHAKAMIGFAKFMGKLVMPRNAALALLVHGLMRATRWIPPLRARFEELEMKPKNVFRQGLFIAGRSASKLRRGAPLPQGWVRGTDRSFRLSDDVLGPGLALIGFGSDIAATLDRETSQAFAAAGGRIVQIAHRGQRLQLAAADSWEDMEGVFLPRAVPFGWVALVRPDRTVLSDGPADNAARIVREGLALLGATTDHAVSSLPIQSTQPF
ncbi:bifunctional 3-(3-hydroxy-phenyl)propionate/3-hydroxycinnamic acid hydroxylase [Paludibacterium purpuratum]|uniref:3-(3-hydroxy-phenyl)propionate hydroxylase n=1 Tax=Paludibacterium purpuratum TaxID=1144873 RepID=A0A4R7B2A0_9NEIS|nr:bifunctional 3-(3-hydroxy-phenyl)propionate/3-hydroxycinnamic acid hydroxylase [Paludibacterium purpuratum]TDR77858.1 3-(3-hydroxy-phenyl)propionate hydroxylase [Paludibacterium purpuratum]